MKTMTQCLMKFANTLGKMKYMRALRDGFMLVMPFTMLASVASLCSGLVFSNDGLLSGFISAESLLPFQNMCTAVMNGTTNIITILISAIIAYSLAKIKKFQTPILCALMAIVTVVIFMPVAFNVTSGEETVMVKNMISFSYSGSGGMIVGILVGLFGTELFIKLSNCKRLQIKMHESVPEAIATSFNNLIPVIITGCAFALGTLLITRISAKDIYGSINALIATPLKGLTTSFSGFLLLTALANMLFIFGIHPTVINSPILKPFLLVATQENMVAYAANDPLPNIISGSFVNYANRLGGVGCTLALLIAIFLFSKRKQNKQVAKVALIPGLFNINEPVIFGLPIIFNPIMAIPFILSPVIAYTIGYAATLIGFVDPLFMEVPATVPVGISGFLAGGGDIKVALIQIVTLVLLVFFYLPFLKLQEKAQNAAEFEESAGNN